MLQRAAKLLLRQSHRILPALRLALGLDAVHLDELEILVAVGLRAEDGRVLFFGQLGQALVDHRVRKITHHLLAAAGGSVELHLGRMQHLDGDVRCGSFHLRVQLRDQPATLGYLAKLWILGLAALGLGIGERSFDVLLNHRHIDITNDHHHGALRRVIGLIQIDEARAVHRLERLFLADGEAAGNLCFRHRKAEAREHRALIHGITRQLLTQDDAALLVDLFLAEQHAFQVIAKELQTIDHELLFHLRQLQHINRLLERGMGVRISSEAHA